MAAAVRTGEEFAVLLPGTDITDARAVAERLRETIEDITVPVEGTSRVGTTALLGLAFAIHDGFDLRDRLRRTDTHLCAAKRDGRNRVVDGLAAAEPQVV